MASRRIAFIITSYIHYSRGLLILEALRRRSDVDLHIILGGAALLPKYVSHLADIRRALDEAGFSNVTETYFNLEGSTGITKAKTAGLGTIEFASIFERVQPDLVVVRADRFEVLAAATAAAFMNIPVAHIEGGDRSGTIDESVRHAITKLAHLHFATNVPSRDRLLRMGEHPQCVFLVGSPDAEIVPYLLKQEVLLADIARSGSGAPFDPLQPFSMVMFHPVTTEINHVAAYARALLEAVHRTHEQVVWFWPNFDAGADDISRELRVFNDHVVGHCIRFMRYLPPAHFIHLLARTRCLIGNSSAGMKECATLGVPVVNIGTRQQGRLRAANVVDVPPDTAAILTAIAHQCAIGRYPPSDVYRGAGTSARIAEVLATAPLTVQKVFHDGATAGGDGAGKENDPQVGVVAGAREPEGIMASATSP